MVLLGIAGIMSAATIAAAADRAPSIWFDDVAFSVPASDKQLKGLTEYVRDCVLKLKDAKKARDDLPLAVTADRFPRIVFVSVSDAIHPARVSLGTGKSMQAAADAAITKLQLSAPANKAFEPRWVKVDIVANVFDQSGADLSKNLLFDRSLFGMAFSKASGAAVLAEEIVANELADHHHAFSLDRFSTYVKNRLPKHTGGLNAIKPKDVVLYRFNALSMFADKHETAKLYRGHRMYHKLTKKVVLEAATEAKNYMIRSVNPSGQFAFLYHADHDKLSPRYDIGHHYNNVFALLDTYEIIKDERLLTAASRAFEYGKLSIGNWTRRGHRVHCILDEKKNVYLRYNALALMAYAKLVKHRGSEATKEEKDHMHRLGLAITLAQQPNGYITQHQTYPDGRIHDAVTSPVFLPGEAMAALSELNKVDPQKRWAEALEKIGNYVIQVRDKDRTQSRMIQDTWTVEGMGQLYRLTKQRQFLEHSLKITRALRSKINTRVRYEDWYGGCYEPPGTAPTASRAMSIAFAYEIARDAKYTTEAKANLEAITRSNAFLLQAQFRPENAMYFKDPQRILGAFRESLTVPIIRIDYVQYSLKSLLRLYRIMEADGVDAIDVQRPKRKSKP